jgi:transcriptional regulator with XRE-family HTH domain
MAPEPVTGGSKPSLGKLLKETRVTHRRTQKQVEQEVEIDRSRLSAYENDRQPMTVGTLEKLAAAIGLELPWEPGTEDTENKKSCLANPALTCCNDAPPPPVCRIFQ